MAMTCHPEQSEGSQPKKNARFFALLRMTVFVSALFFPPLHAELFVGEGATGLASMKIPTSARATA